MHVAAVLLSPVPFACSPALALLSSSSTTHPISCLPLHALHPALTSASLNQPVSGQLSAGRWSYVNFTLDPSFNNDLIIR